jgi:hypothetical protein
MPISHTIRMPSAQARERWMSAIAEAQFKAAARLQDSNVKSHEHVEAAVVEAAKKSEIELLSLRDRVLELEKAVYERDVKIATVEASAKRSVQAVLESIFGVIR